MKIDCVGCLHGHFPELEGGDLLIVTGDLTARDNPYEYGHFSAWIARQKYSKKILIAGNHDNYFEKKGFKLINHIFSDDGITYLCDSGTDFEGLKIWGSPWTKTFEGMNPHCKAFTVDTDEELAEKWALIPEDTDILITHGPSWGNLDYTTTGESVGSLSLWMMMLALMGKLKLHAYSHIHEAYGSVQHYNGIRLVNCSIMNERYQPVNKPVRIEL